MAATNLEVWQSAGVIEVREIAQGIRSIVLRQSKPVKAAAGSHIDLMISVHGEMVRRSYSVVSQSADLRDLSIAVFQVKNSRGGSIAMHQLAVGDQLQITQALQNFPLRIGAKNYVILAGGIGVTALIEMSRVLQSVNANYQFVYAARSRAAMSFKTELENMHGSKLQTFIDDEGNPLNVDELLADLPRDTELYMCGPIRLMDAVRRKWIDSGFEITNLRYETFGASGWFESETFTVRLANQELDVLVDQKHSMLESLENAGLEVMADCRKGECGLCELKIVNFTGQIDHRDVFLSEHQKAEGQKIISCVSRLVAKQPAGEGAPGQQAILEIFVD